MPPSRGALSLVGKADLQERSKLPFFDPSSWTGKRTKRDALRCETALYIMGLELEMHPRHRDRRSPDCNALRCQYPVVNVFPVSLFSIGDPTQIFA